MAGLVVHAEQVLSKIAIEVAPNGVDVVCPVLRVVKLNEKRRCLHTVIVQIPLIDAAGPSEENILPRFLNLLLTILRELLRNILDVFAQQIPECTKLFVGHLRCDHAGWLSLDCRLPACGRQDVLVGHWIHNRRLALRDIQRLNQIQSEVIFSGKCTETFPRSLPHSLRLAEASVSRPPTRDGYA